jgi:hypothetical protein
MSRYVVYTAVFGNIGDQLHEPVQASGVRYVAFVDSAVATKQTHKGWELLPPRWERPDKRRQARQHKCLAHELFPETEYTLWVDGCLTPRENMQSMVEYLLNDHDLAAFEHAERNCVYQEVEACIRLKKDQPELMRNQVARYRKEQYPYNNGLAETTAVLRRHTPQIAELNQAWWKEIREGSVRDQLSLDYVCWRLGVRYTHLSGSRTKSSHFVWRPHR